MAVFVIVLFAFMIGLHNLYYYFKESNRRATELEYEGPVKAQEAFGS